MFSKYKRNKAMQPFPPPKFWRALLEVRWRIIVPYNRKRPLISRFFVKPGSLWEAIDVLEECLKVCIDNRWHDDGN